MPHISVKDLNIYYGKHHALRDVSVDIPDGQITAVIGPSGCGKTTFLKSLNRLTDLYEEVNGHGSVKIDDADIFAPNADVLELRKKLGYLSQRPFPLPMSIYENITFGPRIHNMKRLHKLSRLEDFIRKHEVTDFDLDAAIKQAATRKNGTRDLFVEFYLRLAGLWDEVKDRLHSPASKLSIGQQQRLALARTLAVEPEIILADEPTSALDPFSAKLIEEQFQKLKKNYSIIVVTHILRQARRIADYVLFFYLGELVEHGTAADIFHDPKHERTRSYLTGEIS